MFSGVRLIEAKDVEPRFARAATHLGTATSSVSRYSELGSTKSCLCTTSASDLTERLPLTKGGEKVCQYIP